MTNIVQTLQDAGAMEATISDTGLSVSVLAPNGKRNKVMWRDDAGLDSAVAMLKAWLAKQR